MKVHDSYLEPAAPSLGRARETEEPSASGAKRGDRAAGGAEADGVRLSGLSERLLNAASTEPAGREARIAHLASAYRSETYNVDAAEVSRRIVDSALWGDA